MCWSVCVCVWQLYRYVQESGRHNQHSTLSEQTEEERNPCRLSVWRQLELFFHSSFFQPVSPYPITCQEQIFRELTPTETHTHPQSPCQHTLSTSRSKHRLNARYQQASKILEVQWTHNKWKALINPHIAMWEQTGSDLKEKNMFWAQMSIFFFLLDHSSRCLADSEHLWQVKVKMCLPTTAGWHANTVSVCQTCLRVKRYRKLKLNHVFLLTIFEGIH